MAALGLFSYYPFLLFLRFLAPVLFHYHATAIISPLEKVFPPSHIPVMKTWREKGENPSLKKEKCFFLSNFSLFPSLLSRYISTGLFPFSSPKYPLSVVDMKEAIQKIM